MKNLTLAVDETILDDARDLARRRQTTLNALVRSLLVGEIEQDKRIAQAKQGLKRLMDNSTADFGPDYKWNRDDIYAEREDRIVSGFKRADLRGGGQDK